MLVEIQFPLGTPERHKMLFCNRFREFGYEFRESEHAPFLVVTPYIYRNQKARLDFLNKCSKCITIFDAFAEALFPDFNLFDYAIGMDDYDVGGRMISCPLRMEYFLNLNEQCQREYPQALCERRFCNFIYSNARAHPMRDRIFHTLNACKKVDSLGRHLNNATGDGFKCGDANGDSWLTSSIRQKGEYKFTIASENAQYTGYVSEKLPASFLAGSIPIYWGNPSVTQEYNPEAFVNCHAFDKLEDMVEYVRYLDHDNDAYMKVLQAPPRTPQQEAGYTQRYQRAQEALKRLFADARERKPLKGEGYWPGLYLQAQLGPKKTGEDQNTRKEKKKARGCLGLLKRLWKKKA